MLDDGGAIHPEERRDLQQLQPSDYTPEGSPAAPERITVAWYEGYLSIFGLPFRTG